ncbi:hypothetical protein BJ742DRAFT_803539 [Cladochytrium replicatum]|nr:hypothetical protein BJ742DRAFT_803539 [Cladochytrium replicatum]
MCTYLWHIVVRNRICYKLGSPAARHVEREPTIVCSNVHRPWGLAGLLVESALCLEDRSSVDEQQTGADASDCPPIRHFGVVCEWKPGLKWRLVAGPFQAISDDHREIIASAFYLVCTLQLVSQMPSVKTIVLESTCINIIDLLQSIRILQNNRHVTHTRSQRISDDLRPIPYRRAVSHNLCKARLGSIQRRVDLCHETLVQFR